MSDATCPLCGAACTRITVLGISMFGCRCTGDRGYAISLDERINDVVAEIEQLEPPFVQKFPLAKTPAVPVGEFDGLGQPLRFREPTGPAPRMEGLEAWLPEPRTASYHNYAAKYGDKVVISDRPPAPDQRVLLNPNTYRHLMDEFQRRYDAHTHSTSAPSSVAHIALDERVNPDIAGPPPDPLDVEYDDVTLRALLVRAQARAGAADGLVRPEDVPGWPAGRTVAQELQDGRLALTTAQRAAVSAHWSAELRAGVEAGKQADRERVVLDCAEEL